MGTDGQHGLPRQNHRRHEEHLGLAPRHLHRAGRVGFRPCTGVLSYEGDPGLQRTEHLTTIMGGFQVMNELMEMIDLPEWNRTWLTFAREYKEKARTITHNPFPVTRLTAYAAAQTEAGNWQPKLG